MADHTRNPGAQVGPHNKIEAEVNQQIVDADPRGLAAPPHGGSGLLITHDHHNDGHQQEQCHERSAGIAESRSRRRREAFKEMRGAPQQHTTH